MTKYPRGRASNKLATISPDVVFRQRSLIVLAIQFEENDLVSEQGAAYEEYRRQVPMLLPGRARLAATAPAVTSNKAAAAPNAVQSRTR
jgi:hypothetical protein